LCHLRVFDVVLLGVFSVIQFQPLTPLQIDGTGHIKVTVISTIVPVHRYQELIALHVLDVVDFLRRAAPVLVQLKIVYVFPLGGVGQATARVYVVDIDVLISEGDQTAFGNCCSFYRFRTRLHESLCKF
jgi:hypothetical protein